MIARPPRIKLECWSDGVWKVGVLECWSDGVLGIRTRSWNSRIAFYASLHYSNTPSPHSSGTPSFQFFLCHFHHQIPVRIDADFVLRRYQRRGKRQFNNRRPSNYGADGKVIIVIDLRVDEFAVRSGEKHLALAFEGSAGIAAAFSLRTHFWFVDLADGVDANLADLDARFRVAGADAIELLIFLLEGRLHVCHALGIESIKVHGHLDTGGLAAVAHREVATILDLMCLESFGRHIPSHFFLNAVKALFDHSGIGGEDILAAH